MLDFSATRLTTFAATWVGCKNRYEGVSIPRRTLTPVDGLAEELLTTAILKPFEKTEEFFYLHHLDGIENNRVYQSVNRIFADPTQLSTEAGALTELLYSFTENPKVQGGEFFLAYFEDMMLAGEPCSGLGLWKIEDKETYFRTDRSSETFAVNPGHGIQTKKPQVAAIIFNLDESEGYRVCAIDSITKKGSRSFWKDEFLGLRPIEDNYFQTRHHIAAVTEFIGQKAPIKFGLNRMEAIGLLNKAGDYFKDNDMFEVDDFNNKLFGTEEKKSAFLQYLDSYEAAYNVPLENRFDISQVAVKKEFKLFKAKIKLDENFTIEVKSRADLVEVGYDESTGKKFYKIYFEHQD